MPHLPGDKFGRYDQARPRRDCEQKLFESDRGPQSQMEFWFSKEKFMPILASLALNFSSIPTSTSIVESSFLHANNFRKDDRNRLSQEHTNDQLVIYYDNLMIHKL